MNIECIAPVGDQCGEAATWVAEQRMLYWTDVNRFLVHRLQPEDRSVRTWQFDEPCVALFPTTEHGILFLALGSRIIRWCPETDEREDLEFRLEGWPGSRLNDGRAGPGGEILI